MKTLLRFLQSIACIWLAVGFSSPAFGGVIINSYIFATSAGVSTSYANSGGSGNRTAGIPTITQSDASAPQATTANLYILKNGSIDNFTYMAPGVADGKWIKFDFGTAKVINEAKWYQSAATAQGTWKFEGSNDDSTYADVGSNFTLGGATTQTITAISGNTTAYRYYRLTKVSGSTSAGPWTQEIEFKISA